MPALPMVSNLTCLFLRYDIKNFNMRIRGTDNLSMSICNSGLNSILYSHVNFFLIFPARSASKMAKPQLEPELLFWIHFWSDFKAELNSLLLGENK